jgi:methionyl-tRNA formyltransferase
MLPELVWSMPPMGTINVHGSLLPQYRGAAPINWAVINGEIQTGVTTFKLKHEIDTGNILCATKIDIEEADNAGILHDKMKNAGADLLLKTIQGLASGSLTEQPQDNITGNGMELKHAPKIFTETCNINWNNSCRDIHNLIRGLSPYPGAFTSLEGKKMKIFASSFEEQNMNVIPGTFDTDHKTYLRFAATNGYVYAKDVQIEGKKRMPVVDFLRGYRFS